jgi:uncharacterized protein (DUF2344 family)
MNQLKVKCSQMSLSDLQVLKNTIVSHYQSEIKNASNSEDKFGIIEESKKFESEISELILSKSIDIVFN